MSNYLESMRRQFRIQILYSPNNLLLFLYIVSIIRAMNHESPKAISVALELLPSERSQGDQRIDPTVGPLIYAGKINGRIVI